MPIHAAAVDSWRSSPLAAPPAMEEVHVVVVSSSDAEEDDGGGGRSGRDSVRRGRSSKRSASRPRAAPDGRKRRRIRKKGDGALTAEQRCTEQVMRFEFHNYTFWESATDVLGIFLVACGHSAHLIPGLYAIACGGVFGSIRVF